MSAADTVQGSGARKKILIVEDDADQLLVRTLVFQKHGFDCIQSADASDALLAAHEHSPDCVVMDLNIPTEQDGVRLVQSLRAVACTSAIVILTGRRIASLRTSPGLQEVTAFVQKGSPTAELIATVKNACG